MYFVQRHHSKLLKIAWLSLGILVDFQHVTLAHAGEKHVLKAPSTPKNWQIHEELQHIKRNLDNSDQHNEPDDLSKIERELNQIEQALGYRAPEKAALEIRQEDQQNSLRQTDGSLNSLKLDELNRIEKTFNYDAWMAYCEKSPGCKKQSGQNK